MLRAPTSIETVIIAYTPTILCAPVFRSLGVGAVAGQYHLAQLLITRSDDLQQAVRYVVQNAPEVSALMPKTIPVISPIVMTLTEGGSVLLSVLACEAVAWFGGHDRLRVYVAVCVATALATIPQEIFHAAQIALTVKIAALPTK
jgi:hypothetical protein